jgi:hypothetical protein
MDLKLKSHIMDAAGINRALSRLASEIVEHNRGTKDLLLVGIRRRGVPLAERLLAIEAHARLAHLRGKADTSNPGTCQACHGQAPHKKTAKLNDHTAKVACQTCHIPSFARGGTPTKMSWDWSTAGKRGLDGKPLVVKNEEGHVVYNGIKGDFVMAS